MNTAGVVECEADQAMGVDFDVDFIEEIRLRTWARKNYVGPSERCDEWHPVIVDEMLRIDQEI